MGPPNRSDLKLVSEKDFQGHKPVAFLCKFITASTAVCADKTYFSVTLFSSVSVADLPPHTYML